MGFLRKLESNFGVNSNYSQYLESTPKQDNLLLGCGGKPKFRHSYRYRIILGNGQVFLGSRGFARFTSKTPISESDIISMLCIAHSHTISEFRYKIPIWRGARSWPMGPSERRLPSGSSTQMAPSANSAVGTNAQFALVGSHEKLGF